MIQSKQLNYLVLVSLFAQVVYFFLSYQIDPLAIDEMMVFGLFFVPVILCTGVIGLIRAIRSKSMLWIVLGLVSVTPAVLLVLFYIIN